METREAILTRRSVRNYEERPVPAELLEEILEAGMYAPSAVNYQPWYFVVVQSREAMEKLVALMGRVSAGIEPGLRERFPDHPEVVSETTGFVRKLGNAPVCILAFALRPDYPKTAESIAQSVAAAIENMLLLAMDRGLGSCWLTAPVEAGMAAELRDAFAPGKGELLAVVTLGYAAQTPKAPPRKAGRYTII